MGEAKRRREWRACQSAVGLPVPRPDRCPACGGRPIFHTALPGQDCEYGVCGACAAVWEAFPAMMVEDPVCAEPCDNCAFRAGSPEQQDTERWKELIASLNPDGRGWFQGRFYCHKGVPIDQKAGPGNFLFPKKPVDLSGITDDPAIADDTWDVARMRTCSGFLRMFWEQADKARRRKEDGDG